MVVSNAFIDVGKVGGTLCSNVCVDMLVLNESTW
jgi:hypothetical protein